MQRFFNRREAGIELAEKLGQYSGRRDVVVLGLARGGVPVAFEVARALRAPLDVFVVRKLGAPGHEELAMGAIATGGVRVLNAEVIQLLGIPSDAIEREIAAEKQELERREAMYRGSRPAVSVRGRTVIVVDDGLATGSTMQAAITALRHQHPAAVIAAAPVVAPDTCKYIRTVADDCRYVYAPEPLYGVGLWYTDFSPTTDTEVRSLLETAVRETLPVPRRTYQY
jgi:putative phosphoribosyl transferase